MAAVDYTDSIWHDSVSYEYLPAVQVTAAQIGSVLTRIQCSMSTYPGTHAPPSHFANDTATALSAGTPVHAVKGFSPRCRLGLARRSGRRLTLTAKGRRLLADPESPWRAVAGELFLALLLDADSVPGTQIKATMGQAGEHLSYYLPRSQHKL